MSKNLVIFALVIGLVAHPGSAIGQADFVAAKFGDLTVGKSTLEAVRKRFPNPFETFRDDSKRTWLYYQNIGAVPGKVEMVTSPKNILEMIVVYPDQLTIDQAKRIFGTGYRLTRFDWDTCFENGGETPIFESVNGPLAFIVYPKLGISFLADQNPVQAIEYAATPPGDKRSRCTKASPK